MKHIKTPVRVDVEHDDWLPRYRVQIVDEGGTVIFCGSRYNTPEEALADPLANELARAINAHDVLVEALEVALRNVRHLSNCPVRIDSFREDPCDCGADDAKERIYDALKLAKGEQE